MKPLNRNLPHNMTTVSFKKKTRTKFFSQKNIYFKPFTAYKVPMPQLLKLKK